jgi:hypothetical protein
MFFASITENLTVHMDGIAIFFATVRTDFWMFSRDVNFESILTGTWLETDRAKEVIQRRRPIRARHFQSPTAAMWFLDGKFENGTGKKTNEN